MQIQPVDENCNPIGQPEPVVASGPAVVQFNSLGQFDFGDLNNQLPLPPGPPINIQTEIVALSLTGAPSSSFGNNYQIHLNPNRPSLGGINNLQNQGGVLTGTAFFDVFVEISVPDMLVQDPNNPGNFQPAVLANSDPIRLEMLFDTATGPPANDVLWMPFFVWQKIPGTPGMGMPSKLFDQFGKPWDEPVTIHTIIPGMQWKTPVVPEPTTAILGIMCLSALTAACRRSKNSS